MKKNIPISELLLHCLWIGVMIDEKTETAGSHDAMMSMVAGND